MEPNTPIITDADSEDKNPYDQPRLVLENDSDTTTEADEEVVDDDLEDDEEPEPARAGTITSLPDPGEFTPTDRSFQVQLYNEDNKPTKTVTIKSVEDFEQLLDEEANFGTASALLKAQRLATKMEAGAERDKADYDKTKADYDQQVAQTKAQQQWLTQTQSELDYMVAQGDLPKIPNKLKNADWNDPEIAKDPGVKAQLDLMKFMDAENKKLKAAGLPIITSMQAAYNAMERRQAKQAAATTTQQRTQARRQQGAKIAGANPGPVSSIPKGVSVGRVVHLRDL